jgi:hypothetical protein
VSIELIAVLLFLLAILGGYFLNWRWTGVGQYSTPPKGKREWHHRKTLWDWMQLFIIPGVLAGAALLFNVQNAQTQREISDNNQRQATLEAYINSMSDHLLKDGLRTSSEDAEIRSIARTRTVSTVLRLDATGNRRLTRFLQESGLITATGTNAAPIISLRDADLHGANLRGANLRGADLPPPRGATARNRTLRWSRNNSPAPSPPPH